MSKTMDTKRANNYDNDMKAEIYFLIAKFLSASPLQETCKVLHRELKEKDILSRRLDWLGNEHELTLEELEQRYPHIRSSHLLEICSRLGPILDRDIPPSITGVTSLLGAGRQSLLRTESNVNKVWKFSDYINRKNGLPLGKTIVHRLHNIVRVIQGRHISGRIVKSLTVHGCLYTKLQLLRKTLGHLSAVYCMMFDKSGKYIITGADDMLIKLWSATDGRLLSTFRGASGEITDIDINLDNSLLAAGCLDHSIRVWELSTTSPIAVLLGHTGMITSVNFCPSPVGDIRYLITTSTDGSIAFWTYSYGKGTKPIFITKPYQYYERMRPGHSQMICASFSPGGTFLAAGSGDHNVRIYMMHGDEGPKRIYEIAIHTDAVDSIQWASNGLKFISGSKDGSALIWHFESQQWKSRKLQMSETLPGVTNSREDDVKKLKVTMVSWTCNDNWVTTAVNDLTIKVWNTSTAKLTKILKGHKDEVYVLESHPKDENIILSGGHDGQLFIWDIVLGERVAEFQNIIEGQGFGSIFDAKWSGDGTMFAATDSHGHILLFGFGTGHPLLKILPKELFFHTDYRPLIRDTNHYVLDEQTQTAPHLMPPPFLVDIDGNPHPPALQRLVPGREHCPSDQLIPNIAVGDGGVQEVIEGIPNAGPRSGIDRLIQAVARRYGVSDQNNQIQENGERNNEIHENGFDDDAAAVGQRQVNSPRAHALNSPRAAIRRNGEVQGVRHSVGNWQRDGSYVFTRHTAVKPIKPSLLKANTERVLAIGEYEQSLYAAEMKRRPLMISTGVATSSGTNTNKKNRSRTGTQNRYHTRRDEPEEDQQDMNCNSTTSPESGDSSAGDEEVVLSEFSSSDTDSTEYSDWVMDQPGQVLEPPKRSKRRPVRKINYSPNDSSRKSTPVKQKVPLPNENIEITEKYKPSEWLAEIIPRKTPYYPQMGDEVVYWAQGYRKYLDAVEAKDVYPIAKKIKPWERSDKRDHEFVKVVGIKYEIKPPRLCCLKLAIIEPNGTPTGHHFTIKYHDMADVLDFLVLKQTYDIAVTRNWGPGDRFRCMIDDGWWVGQIQEKHPINPSYQDSLFMSLKVRWDNGEYEYMSPWDLEPINEERLPAEVGGAVPVLPEEIRMILYQPTPEEWPRGDCDATCRRILHGLDQVMGLSIAEPFIAPVDLSIYPSYAYIVEYPIDLASIKARLENRFYRRITSVQFDVRYLATNAEKFNKLHSAIVKQARIVTDLCLRIIREEEAIDVPAVYHQLMDTYHSSESESETDQVTSPRITLRTARRSQRLVSQNDWKVNCRALLDMIWNSDDATPFREPVDNIEHPDYYQIIDTPMDLRSIKEDLHGDNYETPNDFARDMRLIFSNSRNYNTNKKSRIYSMTLRISTLFETHMKPILTQYRSSMQRKSARKTATRKIATRGNNAVAGPSRKIVPDNSSSNNTSDNDETEDNVPLINSSYRLSNGVINGNTSNQDEDHSQDSDSDSDEQNASAQSSSCASDTLPIAVLKKNRSKNSDSGDNYTPNRRTRRRAKTVKRNKPSKARTRGKKQPMKQDVTSESESESSGSSLSEVSVKPPTRRPKYESDHSYHLELPKPRYTVTYDSESDDCAPRPRRNTKAQNPIESDVENADEDEGDEYYDDGNVNEIENDDEDEDEVEEEEEEEDDDDDEEEEVRAGPSRLHTVRTRRGKRPHYNEDSEEESKQRPVKRVLVSFSSSNINNTQPTSVSSRGRIRKLTAKAQGLGILRD